MRFPVADVRAQMTTPCWPMAPIAGIGPPADWLAWRRRGDLVVAREKKSRAAIRTSPNRNPWTTTPTGCRPARLRFPTWFRSGSRISRPARRLRTACDWFSDGQLELLDNSYTYEKPSAHLGEKFHIRLTDPDRDTTDDRDTVTIASAARRRPRDDDTDRERWPTPACSPATLQPEFIGETKPAAAPPGGASSGSIPTTTGFRSASAKR